MNQFLAQESASGFVLIGASLVALLWANSPFGFAYAAMLHVYVGPMDLHRWVDDGLMAAFFLLVGLEIKREFLAGELSSPGKAALPAIAAAGGMLVPAAVCTAFLWGDAQRLRGWAIPSATDIAFALAALALVGRAVPPSLKVFLTALAVIDDLGAVLIIALFYTASLALWYLLGAIACVALLVFLNRMRVYALPPYLAIGVALWFCVLNSGVHATVAAVVLAMTIPLPSVEKLEHALVPWVAFGVVPIFGLFNAGVSFAGVHPSALLGAVPLGIALGLFVGKQAGIFGFAWAATKLRLATPLEGVTWRQLYGVALLGGIGFTMSLFIATLAFGDDTAMIDTKLGIFAGSALSAVAGFLVLKLSARKSVSTPS
jgi:NhaA family Na+:H+ antiporter